MDKCMLEELHPPDRGLSTDSYVFWHSPTDREDALGLPVIPSKGLLGGCEQGLHTLKKLTRGHLAARMSPGLFDRVQPGTVRGKIEDRPPRGASYYGSTSAS
jgi:hypothetical protein